MITAYSPLAQGRLINNPVLEEIGMKYQKSAAQVALKWLLEKEQVIAIPKATTPEHLQANLEATQFDLDDEDFFAINNLEKISDWSIHILLLIGIELGPVSNCNYI